MRVLSYTNYLLNNNIVLNVFDLALVQVIIFLFSFFITKVFFDDFVNIYRKICLHPFSTLPKTDPFGTIFLYCERRRFEIHYEF